MTEVPVTEAASESPTVRESGPGRWGSGVLAAGLAALAVALLLSISPASRLPVWVLAASAVLVVLGIGCLAARLPRRWLAVLGAGAAGLAAWALYATYAEVRYGLLGTAIPVLLSGSLAAAVGAGLSARAPRARGSLARQAFPAAATLVVVGLLAGVTAIAAPALTVAATTAERVEPAAVPDPADGVRWTSGWTRGEGGRVKVVAAGAGVVVATGDQVVALDGSTGEQRWHYRRPGTYTLRVAASPDGRTVVATFTADDHPEQDNDDRTTSSLFAFDAFTGDVLWSRWPVDLYGAASSGGLATDHVFVKYEGETLVAVELGSGAEAWRWTPAPDCRANGNLVTGPDAVLLPVSCGDLDDGSSAVIGLDDREGTQRWRAETAGAPYAPGDVDLTTSPDGRATAYQPAGVAPLLLDSATGEVLHRAGPGDVRIAGPDARTPVLVRGDGELVVRDLGSGADRPLAGTCPVPEPATPARAVVTAKSVVVLCEPRGPVTAYSRNDGTETADLEGAVGRNDPTMEPELLAAPGAIVLVVQDHDDTTAAVTGLA